jgi:hypothetical protein
MAMQVALPEQQCLGEPRLADAAGTRDADEAMLVDQRSERREIAVAADQRRQNGRQIRLLRCGDPVRRRRFGEGQRGRRRSDRGDEAIAEARHRLDRVGSEQLAQRRDLLLDVVVRHDHVVPDGVQELLLADEPAGPLGEQTQQIERTGAEVRGVAIDQQAPFARLQLEATREAQGGVG